MQVRDYNASTSISPAGLGDTLHRADMQTGAPPGRAAEAELAYLRLRIEHLEAVVETARGLMTSNQEKLLRRLHDVPQEMARLASQANGALGAAKWNDFDHRNAGTGAEPRSQS